MIGAELSAGGDVVLEAKSFSLPAVSAVERMEFSALDNRGPHRG